MTREEALELLDSSKSHLRLKASRFLAQHAEPRDLEVIEQRLDIEPVSYVQSSLKNAISRLLNRPRVEIVDPENETTITDIVKKQIYAEAVEWVSGLLLHEIASSLGLVKLALKREFSAYEGSSAQEGFRKLDKIFASIEQLKTATSTPKPEDFDLAALIRKIISESSAGLDISKISLEGPDPFIIHSDEGLVRLALSNGIKNACEAVMSNGTEQDHAVVISWGKTDIDYFCVIWDRGIGLKSNLGKPFSIGQSNKEGHIGFGLSIAVQALEMIGGDASLQPRLDGGAKFEARWEQL